MASTPSSDNSGFRQSYFDNATKFNPTTAVVIIGLIGGCFVLAFVSVLVRKCMRGDRGTSTQSSTLQSGVYSSKTHGLQKADVDALPLVHTTDLDEKHDHECPVCLTDFEPEETLRLLPSCKHVFHQECIDAWFDSHSTCPLCRASLLSQPVGDAANCAGEQVTPGEPVETIAEVSENGDSDAESHRARDDVPLEDSRTVIGGAPLGAMIFREDERSSARGTLFRNSESFKRAARGVAAHESAASPLPDKNFSFRKPASASIRRSSSLSADLISLRNLLTGGDQSVNAVDAPSGSSRWFTRARSLELSSRRDRADHNDYSQGEWVTIDLETGKATPDDDPSSPSKGESSKGPAPERAWSERWSLASLRSLKGAILSRSTSDVSSRAAHLPV